MDSIFYWYLRSLCLIFRVIIWSHTSGLTFLVCRTLQLLGISNVSDLLRSISLVSGSSQIFNITVVSVVLSGLPNYCLEHRSCPICCKKVWLVFIPWFIVWLIAIHSSPLFSSQTIFFWSGKNTMSSLMKFILLSSSSLEKEALYPKFGLHLQLLLPECCFSYLLA